MRVHITSANTSDIMLSPEGLTMAPYKVQLSKIGQYTKSQGYSIFPRLCQFLPSSLIYGYSEITVPAHVSYRKGTPGISPMSAIQPLKHLKKAFTTAPVLTHWIPDHVELITSGKDWTPLDYALAAVLSHYDSDGDLHPIAFHSPTFFSPGTQLR